MYAKEVFMVKYELHSHSIMSDGCETPTQVVRDAKKAGVRLLALSDHDSMKGVEEAIEEGKRIGVTVLPAIEIDTELFGEELHILGIGVDIHEQALFEAIEAQCQKRLERLWRMVDVVEKKGIPVREHIKLSGGSASRADIAKALFSMGYGKSVSEAFNMFLTKDLDVNCEYKRLPAKTAIELINGAGGIAILAHPCLYGTETELIVKELVPHGLMGIEAYYISATEAQRREGVALAEKYGLIVTCGTDFHGMAIRPTSPMGGAFVNNEDVRKGYEFIVNKLGIKFYEAMDD